MPRTLTTNSLSGMMASETGRAYLVLLTITYDGPTTVRLTNDTVDTVFNGDTYTALPFDIVLPTNESGKVPESQLVIDNVDRQLIEALRTQSTPMGVQIDVVATDDIAGGDVAVSFTDFTLRSIEYNQLSISGRLTLEDFLAEPFPKDVMSQVLFPGLFAFGQEGEYVPPDVLYTDFSEYASGSPPSDWTEMGGGTVWQVETDTGQYTYAAAGKFMVAPSGSSGNTTWDISGGSADFEVLMEFDHRNANQYVTPKEALMVRAQTGTDTVAFSKAYALWIDDQLTTAYLRLTYRTSLGGWTLVDTVDIGALTRGRKAFFRYRLIGDQHRCSFWLDDLASEPGSWIIDTTHTNIPDAGTIGFAWVTDSQDYPVTQLAIAYDGGVASFP